MVLTFSAPSRRSPGKIAVIRGIIVEKRIDGSFLLPETELSIEFRVGAFDGQSGVVAELIGGHSRRVPVGERNVGSALVDGVNSAVVVEDCRF